MSSELNITHLIKQSSCTTAPDCWKWLQEKGLHTKVSYIAVSMAFWDLSQQNKAQYSSISDRSNQVIPSPLSSILKPTDQQQKYVSKAVLQGEAGITNANSPQPIIASFGASLCVILSIYNPRAQIAALAHIDASADLQKAIQMLNYQTQKIDPGPILIEMSTGILEENETLERLRNMIEAHENMSLKKIHCSSCLSIDARSGETSPLKINPHKIDLGSNYKQRMEARGLEAIFSVGKKLSIKLVFDTRV